MTSALSELLEDFSAPRAQPVPTAMIDPDSDAFQSMRLASFEEGYKAGWDDAIKAQGADKAAISGDFAQNLQDLSFTYHEAVAHVVKSTAPLLREMVGVILPALAEETLGLQISDLLQQRLRGAAQPGVEIRVAPENVERVRALLIHPPDFPARILPQEGLGPGQARLRFADEEQDIDMADALAEMSGLVAAFLHENEKGLRHG